jgi:RNA polymerase sigma-70 factor (ECF subfamily)
MDPSRSSVNDLAKACSNSPDAAEWEEFLARCAPMVSLIAMRVCRLWMNHAQPAMVDDIAQEVYLKLCEQERRILREFEPRAEDSFLGLLRIVSASVANDYFRLHTSVKRGGKVVTISLDEELATGQTASARPARAMHQSTLLSELDRRLQAAPGVQAARDRDLFWLYYLHGFTAEEIASLPGTELTAKGVESALRRIANWLRQEIQARSPGSDLDPG